MRRVGYRCREMPKFNERWTHSVNRITLRIIKHFAEEYPNDHFHQQSPPIKERLIIY